MPIIFIPENNEYNPLELEPYRSFNRKFEDREDDIDGALIKLSIPNQRSIFIFRDLNNSSCLIDLHLRVFN